MHKRSLLLESLQICANFRSFQNQNFIKIVSRMVTKRRTAAVRKEVIEPYRVTHE
jgi:uncharacterized protein involved in type VI secretion and phage assembly